MSQLSKRSIHFKFAADHVFSRRPVLGMLGSMRYDGGAVCTRQPRIYVDGVPHVV
jgi:hypothetical protein